MPKTETVTREVWCLRDVDGALWRAGYGPMWWDTEEIAREVCMSTERVVRATLTLEVEK